MMALTVAGLIACATVLTGSLGGEALARVERSVQSQWRPAYDLIVVPADADLAVDVGGTRVLQSNFMSSLPNGITLDQWRGIKELPGVDVAAPVANIGYFSRSQSYYRIEGLRPGIYSVDRKVWWNSGLDRRFAGQSTTNPLPTRAEGCADDAPIVLSERGGNIAEEAQLEKLVTGYRVGLPVIGEHPAEWQCRGLDPGGVFTLFGIDPKEEQRLVGLNDAITDGDPLTAGMGLQPVDYTLVRDGKTYAPRDVPLLLADGEWVDSDFQIRFQRWRTPPYRLGDLLDLSSTRECARKLFKEEEFLFERGVAKFPARCIDRDLQQQLASLPRRTELTTQLPSPGGRSLIKATYKDGRWVTRADPGVEVGRYWVATASPQQYEPVASGAPKGDWIGALRAVTTGSYGPEPTYRTQLPPTKKPFLRYQVVGSYDPSTVAEQFSDQSRWQPEGTYQVPSAVARYDGNEDPVDTAQLRPTGNPLGYLVQPPQALTSLRAARQLAGDAPISAIRVRLSGVDDAGEDSWQRIEDIVRRIRDDTGLQVLVMAGSSPAQVLVELPGVDADDQPSGVQAWTPPNVSLFFDAPPLQPARTVAGFGWVEESWLVEGAAVTYLRAGASAHLWLLAVVATAGLVYLAAAFTSLGLSRIPTVAIRRAVGWPRSRVFAGELGRAMLLGLVGSVIGLIAGLAGGAAYGLAADPVLVWLAVPVAVLVCGLAALWPTWRVSGVPLAAALAGAEVAISSGKGRRRSSHVQRVPAMAVLELWRLRTRSLLALASGTVAVGAIVTLSSVRDQFAGSLQVTLLGQEVLLQTGPLQQAGTAVAVALAALMLGELLWQAVRDRRRELGMLRAIGWGRRHVIWLMVCQGIFLGVAAAVLGAISTTGILAVTIAGGESTLPLLAATLPWATCAGIVLGAVAAGAPAWAASRIPPAVALRTI